MDHKSQTNSILMSLLRSAIDNSHKNVQSKVGTIDFLNEISKFYELAIIQIDASLKFIQEPQDQILETSRIKIFADLIKLKDLFHGRLNHIKCLRIEKDKEVIEKLENEFRLKQALDLKEKELASLRSKLELDIKPEFHSFEEESHEKFELSYDKFMSIGDRLQIEKNEMIKEMSSDIDILKETLDLTFEQIHETKVQHLDQECRLSIEKETILITIKGFFHDQSVEYYKNKKKDAIIKQLMEEQQESYLQTMAIEEHYMILLNDCYKEFWSHDIEMQVREDVFVYVLHEITKDWSVYDENKSIKMQLTDEIYKSVYVETMNDIQIKLNSEMQKIQNKELVYKKAFARRCENLLLAETEVDLLGDQVEALQDLLRKIYFLLEQNFSHNSQVMDILKLIKKEFNKSGDATKSRVYAT